MPNLYTLYGSYASYYTAKSRSHLRKKGVPFVERLPSETQFREKVRPASGSHRVPQLLAPDGQVVQDSVEMLDYIEARFPAVPAIPNTPVQRTFVHLMELLCSEGLVNLAWQHRWLFEENLSFVIKDFGRSFRPHGSDEELEKYGNLIADRMMSYGLPPTSEEKRTALERQYLAILQLMEQHVQHHPYFLGGHPSAADYAIMGAMHAHLGRDPAGLQCMQQHAPRVFRWVEHMLTPEIQSPKFYDRPIAYPENDAIPATALAVLAHLAKDYGKPFILSCIGFQQAMDRQQPESGYALNPDHDQPTLVIEDLIYRGEAQTYRADLYQVWIAQRAQKYFQSLAPDARNTVEESLGSSDASALLNVPVRWVIERRDNRLFIQ